MKLIEEFITGERRKFFEEDIDILNDEYNKRLRVPLMGVRAILTQWNYQLREMDPKFPEIDIHLSHLLVLALNQELVRTFRFGSYGNLFVVSVQKMDDVFYNVRGVVE